LELSVQRPALLERSPLSKAANGERSERRLQCSLAGGRTHVRERAERGDCLPILVVPPRVGIHFVPEWMSWMQRARRPGRIPKKIVGCLLQSIDEVLVDG